MTIKNWLQIACLWGAGLVLTACGSSEGHAPTEPAAAETGGAGSPFGMAGAAAPRDPEPEPDPEPLPDPFSHEFAALMTQSVRFAALDVSITGTRQVRGIEDMVVVGHSIFEGEQLTALDPSQIYVELDLELTNRGHEEHVYEDRDTWDLMLASGERLMPTDGLNVRILPGDSTTAQLHYPVDAEVELAGAALELNGDDRTSLESERIPLDASYVQEWPRRITSIVSQEVPFVVDTNHATVAIDEAVYDINYERISRAAKDKRIVWLKLAFTSTDDYLGSYNAGDVRVVVNGRSQTAFDYGHGIIHEGATEVFAAAFEIDATATAFEVVFPDGTPEGKRFAVDVADTVLARDIP